MGIETVRSVLVVEDQGVVRAGMIALIQMLVPGCTITGAADYEQASRLLSQGSYDVVFLDIDLKGTRSGLDLLRYLRESESLSKIIMLSASDDPATVIEAISEGASGYIAKAHGDGATFEAALGVVFNDGIYLPTSVFRNSVGSSSFRPQPIRESPLDDFGLSPRLLETLQLVCQGLPNKSIARLMNISESTVRKNYVSELLRVFNVSRRTELVVEVARRGISLNSISGSHQRY